MLFNKIYFIIKSSAAFHFEFPEAPVSVSPFEIKSDNLNAIRPFRILLIAECTFGLASDVGQ